MVQAKSPGNEDHSYMSHKLTQDASHVDYSSARFFHQW